MIPKLRVYAYSCCSTCRNAIKFLNEYGISHEVLPIRETPPKVGELRKMLKHVGGEVRKLFNTSGLDYKAQGLKNRLPAMPAGEALALLSCNGNLVKRPFVIGGDDVGLVGFKPEQWKEKLL
jgi:arsenate reductase